MKTRVKTRKQTHKKRKTRGGYKQYLSNIGFSNGYQLNYDRTMNTPSAIRTSSNWVL